jgi:hypothetical protein
MSAAKLTTATESWRKYRLDIRCAASWTESGRNAGGCFDFPFVTAMAPETAVGDFEVAAFDSYCLTVE